MIRWGYLAFGIFLVVLGPLVFFIAFPSLSAAHILDFRWAPMPFYAFSSMAALFPSFLPFLLVLAHGEVAFLRAGRFRVCFR